jgi:hypothetical protein
MNKFEKILKKTVGIGATAGLSLGLPAFAQNADNIKDNKVSEKHLFKINICLSRL